MSAVQFAPIPEVTPGVEDLASLHNPKVREAVSGSAIRLFLKLAGLWGLSVDHRCILLGGISKQTYHNWQNGKVGVLSRDQLERVSLLLGVQKALKLIFTDDAASLRWLHSENTDFPFAKGSPLDLASRGSVNDLYALRRYLDAWRGIK